MQDVCTYSELTLLQGGSSSSKPARLGVIGNPIAHSKSPGMQQAALDAAGIAASYIRILCETTPPAFSELLDELRRLDFIGANVTIPFKRQAFAACATTDPLAKLSQAVNTLVLRSDGWHGYNTDGPGFAKAVGELTGCELRELRVLIMGACGGAGTALACQCALSGTPQLTLVNRPKPALYALHTLLARQSPGRVYSCSFHSPELNRLISQCDLIVNATSLGLKSSDPLPIPADNLESGQFLYDIITHDTPLQQAALARGCHAANGLDMLLWQGAYSFEHWFGILPSISLMRSALHPNTL